MKAIQVVEPGDMRLVDVEMPALKTPTSVIVKVKAAGICGSDVHILHGKNPYATYPRIVGHEVAGVIAQVGEQVTKYHVGDRVVVEPILFCGKCYPCRTGRQNVCENLQVYGVHMEGAFEEYMCAEESALHILPEGISFEQGALIEPYTIGAQGLWRTDAKAGDIIFFPENNSSVYVVKPTDTFKGVAEKLKLSESELYKLTNTTRLFIGQRIEY